MKNFYLFLIFLSFSITIKVTQDFPEPEPIPEILDDIEKDGFHHFEQFLEIYKNHHLSHAEIRYIFKICDKDKNSKVDEEEWHFFYQFFVQPYEELAVDGDYLFDQGDLQDALVAENEFLSNLQILDEELEPFIKVFDRWAMEDRLNFADYMWIRKLNLAWKECVARYSHTIGKRQIPCALQVTAPGRTLDFTEAEEVFDLAIILKRGKQTGETAQLDFVDFVNVAHLYYYFSTFEEPFLSGIISKRDVTNSMEDSVLPSGLSPIIVDDFFPEDLKEMNFKSFGCLLWAFRIFGREGQEQPGSLSLAEFKGIFEEENFNPLLLKLVENIYTPDQEQIEAAALLRQKKTITEEDYLIGRMFRLQKKNKKQHRFIQRRSHLRNIFRFHQEQPLIQENPLFEDDPIQILYRMFDHHYEQENMKFGSFAKFIKLSFIFIHLDSNANGRLEHDELTYGVKNRIQVIQLTKSEISLQTQMMDWLQGNIGLYVNLKQFLSWFVKDEVFETNKTAGTKNHALQAQLHATFAKLGLRLAITTERLGFDGYSQLQQEKSFHLIQTYKYALEDEIVALKTLEEQGIDDDSRMNFSQKSKKNLKKKSNKKKSNKNKKKKSNKKSKKN